MEKTMPLDLLSSIKGARSSEAVSELFNVIKRAVPENQREGNTDMHNGVVPISELRSDEIERSDKIEGELIRKNFPQEKNGYLIVPKVIEE